MKPGPLLALRRLPQAMHHAARPRAGTLATRQARIVRWCGDVLADLGLGVDAAVEPPPVPMLIVANHVSWLDSLVIGASLPCCFVAKRELWSWPLVGPLLTASGAVPFDRTSPGGLAAAVAACTRRLQQGHSVCVFPEGTTTDGTRLLPFQPAFFESAVAAGAPVLAAAVSYRRDGRPCPEMAWADERFVTSARRVLRLVPQVRGGLQCEPVASPAMGGRTALAEAAQAAVHRLLGLPPAEAGTSRIAAPQAPHGLLDLVARFLRHDDRAAEDLRRLEHRTWGDLGLDSLEAMGLLLALEQQLGRPIPDAQLVLFGTDRTVRELMQGVLGAAPAESGFSRTAPAHRPDRRRRRRNSAGRRRGSARCRR